MTAASGADRDEYDGHVGSCRMFYAERRCTCAGPGSANHGASGADQAFAAAAARWPHGDAANWPDASGADQPTLRDQLVQELHSAFEWQFDQCFHGTYGGGPLNGQPYAMCELFADRLTVMERAKAEGGIDRLTDDELADEVVRRRLTLGAIDRAAIRAVDRAAALRAET